MKRHLYFTGGRWKEHGQRSDTGLLGYGGIIRKIAYTAVIAGGQHSVMIIALTPEDLINRLSSNIFMPRSGFTPCNTNISAAGQLRLPFPSV
ncbi:hypothetical protein KCP70_09315 [Salmonella enterica subsp. enterica]|nr:hypothetical protein KCP70_09315 [Salmonella enterica subsp. enterica]